MLLRSVEAEFFNLLIVALIAVVTHQNSSDILVNLDMTNRTLPVLGVSNKCCVGIMCSL